MDPHISSDTLVRGAALRGDHERRARTTSERLWQLAPGVAAIALGAAVAARLGGFSPVLPLSVLGGGVVGLAAYVLVRQRPREVSDSVVARIDADAKLGGELRSAHWFATRAPRDEWMTFHLDRAAEHVRMIDWARLYLAVRAPRAWASTALLAMASVVVAVSPPATGATGPRPAMSRGLAPGPGPTVIALPGDLRKRLEALLAQIARGEISAEAARAQVAELRDLMSRIDPSIDATLAEFAKRTANGAVVSSTNRVKAASFTSLAERTDQAARSATGLPKDVRWSLGDLAARLANEAVQDPSGGRNATSAATSAEHERASAEAAAAGSLSAALQNGLVLRETAADPAGQMMMAGAGAASSDGRSGQGRDAGRPSSGQLLDIERALRRETVEANADTSGANVIADVRRKTEQGHATVAFTRAALSATFGPSRAVAPPQVPEARRALLGTYFLRR